jgi:hypothetical protein
MICSVPVIAGVLVAGLLFYHLGHHCTLDVSAWSSLRETEKELSGDPNGHVYLRVETYYVIFLCVVVIVCALNSLSFLFRSLNAISEIEGTLKDEALEDVTEDDPPGQRPTEDEIYESDERAKNDWRVKLGMFAVTFRGLALLLNGVLAAYLAVGFSFKPRIDFDELAILSMFLVFMLTDIGLLIAIYGVKKSATWTDHRELLGTLLYIDIPTIISVGLIVLFGPSLLSGLATPESMFRAIAGGGMIVHLVSSQIIQSILLGEEWVNERSTRWSGIPS